MTFDYHVSKLIQSCFLQLRNTYIHILQFPLLEKHPSLNCLHLVKNAATRLLTRGRPFQHYPCSCVPPLACWKIQNILQDPIDLAQSPGYNVGRTMLNHRYIQVNISKLFFNTLSIDIITTSSSSVTLWLIFTTYWLQDRISKQS